MAPIAIFFGVLLTVLGGGVFVYTGMAPEKATALIPAAFGILLIVCGVIARNDKFRMHAMHGAAFLGLVGFGMPAYMVIAGLVRGAEFDLPKQEQAVMAVLCGVFVALCVKSFIDVRKARKLKEADQASAPPTA